MFIIIKLFFVYIIPQSTPQNEVNIIHRAEQIKFSEDFLHTIIRLTESVPTTAEF